MESNSYTHVFNTHADAEEAIRLLDRSGFDVTKLSIIGKGYHTEEHAIGFYGVGDRIKAWGGVGAFWGGIWGLLLGPAVFLLPGVGLVAMAGPIVATLISALEGAVVVGGLSTLGAALSKLGASHDQVIKYESAIKSDQFVLMVHGSAEEMSIVNDILNNELVS